MVGRDVEGAVLGDPGERAETYGHHHRWRVVDGVDIMPEGQERFLVEWCMQWPRPSSQADWARANGVAPRTLQNWLADARFKRVWRERADNAYASPEWTTPLIAETYRLALNEPDEDGGRKFTPSEQLKAIDTFARFVNMTTPTRIEHSLVPADKELAAMSVAELTVAAGLAGEDVLDVESTEVVEDLNAE